MTVMPSSPITNPALEPAELFGLAMAAKTLLPNGLMVKSRESVDASCARTPHARTSRRNERTIALRMARYGIAQREKTKELHGERRGHREISAGDFCRRPCRRRRPCRFLRGRLFPGGI